MDVPALPRDFSFETLDVFTTRRFGGNPLAVFTDARGLRDDEMQALAAEMNLSETTFVLPPADPTHSARVRIFHRTAEMPFAGHPMLGTGVLLAQHGHPHGDTLHFEVPAGVVRVDIARDPMGQAIGGTIAAPQPLQLGDQVPASVIAACTGLAERDVLTAHHAPVVASVGTRYVMAEVSADAVGRAAPVLGAFRAALDAKPQFAGRLSMMVYAREEAFVHARMFAPVAGTWEDPATGSACAALGALLLSLSDDSDAAYEFRQGIEMRRPSILQVTARRAADGIRSSVGGHCVSVLRGIARM